MTTDIRSALESAQEILSALLPASGDPRTDALLFACQQYQNVLTQLAETVKQHDYRIEHLEEETGFRDMRNALNRKDNL